MNINKKRLHNTQTLTDRVDYLVYCMITKYISYHSYHDLSLREAFKKNREFPMLNEVGGSTRFSI